MSEETIGEKLRRITEELKDLEQRILSCDFAPRLLSDFRDSVDNVRQTARIVQMWVGLKEQNRDPYTAISTLIADRVRRTTQMTRELSLDLQALEVDFNTEGLTELHQAIDELHGRLRPLFRNSSRSK